MKNKPTPPEAKTSLIHIEHNVEDGFFKSEFHGSRMDLMSTLMMVMHKDSKIQELLEEACKQMRLYQQDQKFKKNA